MSDSTPGPWLLRRFPCMRELWVTDATPDRDGKFVGQIIAGPNTNPAWEANAVMIHALPELLAFAKAYSESHPCCCWLLKDTPKPKCLLCQAKEAIAKAEGTPP